MNRTIPVQLIDEAKAPIIKPQRITIFLPDELPDTELMVMGTEAVEERPGWRAVIYREITLPTAQVAPCFKLEGIKVVVDATKAAALLALFNYQIPPPPSEPAQ